MLPILKYFYSFSFHQPSIKHQTSDMSSSSSSPLSESILVQKYLSVPDLKSPVSHIISDDNNQFVHLSSLVGEWLMTNGDESIEQVLDNLNHHLSIDDVNDVIGFYLSHNLLFEDFNHLSILNDYLQKHSLPTTSSIKSFKEEWSNKVSSSFDNDIAISTWIKHLIETVDCTSPCECTHPTHLSIDLVGEVECKDISFSTMFSKVDVSESLPLIALYAGACKCFYKALSTSSELSHFYSSLKSITYDEGICFCINVDSTQRKDKRIIAHISNNEEDTSALQVSTVSLKRNTFDKVITSITTSLSDQVKVISLIPINITGYLTIDCEGFRIESFIYYTLIDRVASSFIRLNEVKIPFSKRPISPAFTFPRTQFRFCTIDDILHERWSGVFTLSRESTSSSIQVSYKKFDSDESVTYMIYVITRLFHLYQCKQNEIEKRLERFANLSEDYSRVNLLDDIESGSHLEKLAEVAGDLFVPRYGTGCMKARQPEIYVLTGDDQVDQDVVDKITSETFLIGTNIVKKEVIFFPLPNPRYVFYSNNPEFPYPGLQQNKRLSNKDIYPFIPCLFRDRQGVVDCASRRSIPSTPLVRGGRVMIRRTCPIVEKTPLRVFKTDRLMKFGRLAYVSSSVTSLLNLKGDNKSLVVCRYGMERSPNSFIHCLYVACDDQAYIKASDDIAREKIVVKRRRQLSTFVKNRGMGVVGQELFDYSLDRVVSLIDDVTSFFDPFLFYRLVEVYWKVNIFVIKSKATTSSTSHCSVTETHFEVPRHDLYHIRQYDSSLPTVLIFKHLGSKFDQQATVDDVLSEQCELVVACKVKEIDECKSSHTIGRDDIIKRCFNGDSIHEAFISTHCYNFYSNIKINKEEEIKKEENDERHPIGQVLDKSGKQRALVYGDDEVIYHSLPRAPSTLPVIYPSPTDSDIVSHVKRLKRCLNILMIILRWLLSIHMTRSNGSDDDVVSSFSHSYFKVVTKKNSYVPNPPYDLSGVVFPLPEVSDMDTALSYLADVCPTLVRGSHVIFYNSTELRDRLVCYLRTIEQSGVDCLLSQSDMTLDFSSSKMNRGSLFFRSTDTFESWLCRPFKANISYLTLLDEVDSTRTEAFLLKTTDDKMWLVQNVFVDADMTNDVSSYDKSLYVSLRWRDDHINCKNISSSFKSINEEEVVTTSRVITYNLLQDGSVGIDMTNQDMDDGSSPITLLCYGSNHYASLLPLFD